MIKVRVSSISETEQLGEIIGKVLEKGDIVCLTGDLGAGKTTMTKSIAKAIGVDDYVTSPSYTIINVYEGNLPFYHFDVYRINDVEELYEIGYEEYFFGDGVCVIEWAGMIEEIIPDDRIWVEITHGTENDERIITIDGKMDRWTDVLKDFEIIG